MASFVVKIDDMQALLLTWKKLLATAKSTPVFTKSNAVFHTLEQWPRIKWFYYCDNLNGNTIRIYDTQHLHAHGHFYLEPNTWSKEHNERVIIRGERMWTDDQANLGCKQSLRNQFRYESPWLIFSANKAPVRQENQPHGGAQPHKDIRTNPDRNVRLQYFENLNQLPPFTPSRHPHNILQNESNGPKPSLDSGGVIRLRRPETESHASLLQTITNEKVRKWANDHWNLNEKGFVTQGFACWLCCAGSVATEIRAWWDKEFYSDTHDVSFAAFDRDVTMERAKELRYQPNGNLLETLLHRKATSLQIA